MQKDQSILQMNVLSILNRIKLARETYKIEHQVRLIAVSKTKTVEEIMQVYKMGIRDFGENYVDEIQEKSIKLPQDINWHFIGHLQSNKIKKVLVNNLYCLQTVDRVSLAEKLNNFLEKQKRNLDILIQVKTSQEDSKSGVPQEQLLNLYDFIREKCSNLKCKGLMTIGKQGDEAAFMKMRNLKQDICKKYNIQHQFELSMGMSADFQTAIKYGSTMVRIGSLIFGPRSYPKK